jgi:hypothetical protein
MAVGGWRAAHLCHHGQLYIYLGDRDVEGMHVTRGRAHAPAAARAGNLCTVCLFVCLFVTVLDMN